jgi:hypothetical protein
MPSIQQIIAEIQLAPDLPPNHIAKAVQIIRDAEQRLKLKGATSRPRKAQGKNLVTLQEWEQAHGTLTSAMMTEWIDRLKLCRLMVSCMVDEFRGEMIAKGKQYANFKAAFMTYLAKGYLSKQITACTLERSPHKTATIMDNRGVNL